MRGRGPSALFRRSGPICTGSRSWLLSYHVGEWIDPAPVSVTGYSVVPFDEEKYAQISTTISDPWVRDLARASGVSSITMRYDPSVPFESISRPAGGCRVAWFNGF